MARTVEATRRATRERAAISTRTARRGYTTPLESVENKKPPTPYPLITNLWASELEDQNAVCLSYGILTPPE